MLPLLARWWSKLRWACMLRRVWMLAMPSVGTPLVSLPFSRRRPSGSPRDRLSRYTPVKMTRKPQSSEMVLTASVVLKPRKRMKDATSVEVVKVT